MLHIIWDLDGTLIDSEKDILLSLEKAITNVGVSLGDVIEPLRIGPPIDVMLDKSFGSGAIPDDVKSKIVLGFRKIYDNGEYENTKVFDGIEKILTDKNFVHHIITNKPVLPTKRIFEKLDFEKYFSSAMSPNSLNPEKRMSKQEMFSHLKSKIPNEKFVGIGDSASDCTAALQNGIGAIGVLWGAGTERELRDAGCLLLVKDVHELHEKLRMI